MKNNIEITKEDLIIDGKVRNRQELIEHLGITNKKLRGMGGYFNILKKYGLEKPSPYHWEVENKKNAIIDFIIKFNNNNKRPPMLKEINQKMKVDRGFIHLQMGGYKKVIKDLGIDYKKQITQSQSFKYSKEELIKMFKDVYRETPSVKKLIRDNRKGKTPFGIDTINTVFGNYTNFITSCGMKLNNDLGQKKKANDGHLVDSHAECEIDNFLHENNIKHDVHVDYKNFIDNLDKKYKMDFLLDDGTFVEYFGLEGYRNYSQKMRKKVDIMEKNNINYIAIYPNDLKRLDDVFKDYIGGVS